MEVVWAIWDLSKPACLHTNSTEVWVLSPALRTIQIKMTKSIWHTIL